MFDQVMSVEGQIRADVRVLTSSFNWLLWPVYPSGPFTHPHLVLQAGGRKEVDK